jgi:hypothetical protein
LQPTVLVTAIRGRRRRPDDPRPEAGQSLVEFSLIFFPLFLILMAIIQFGFVFSTYVTMTNASRDAARMGTIYSYDSSLSKVQNDLLRNESVRAAVKITYVIPTGVLDTDSRIGQRLTVSATYHQDLVVPLISAFLPKDGGGRLSLTGVTTMVVN